MNRLTKRCLTIALIVVATFAFFTGCSLSDNRLLSCMGCNNGGSSSVDDENPICREKGHIEIVESGKEPTCLKKGYTEKKYCERCGKVLSESKIIPKTGHKLGEWYVFEQATETTAGVSRRDCKNKNCGYYETKETAKVGHTYTKVSTVAPTCAEYGYDLYKCSDCDHTYKDNFTEKLRHAEQIEKIEATCVSDGYVKHTCKNCDYTYVTDYVTAYGHSFGEWQSEILPACEQAGSEKRVCMRAGCAESQTRKISAEGHKYVLAEVNGSAENARNTYVCKVCQNSITLYGNANPYAVKEESQLLEQNEDFSFIVSCSESNAEAYIRENLNIIDAYFLDSENEDRAEVKQEYKITALSSNTFKISPVKKYEQGIAYAAKIKSGAKGITFKDYSGEKVIFSIKSDNRSEVKQNANIVFLKKLEEDNSGYYPYELNADTESEFIYLTLQKADGIKTGDVLFIGEAESLDEAFSSGEECFYGKVEVIYQNDDSEYILVLSCPDLAEIFDELNIHYNKNINFDDYPEAAENLQNEAQWALLSSEDFARFIAVSDVSVQNYCYSHNMVASPLTQQNFIQNVSIGLPEIKVDGTSVTLKLAGEFKKPLKSKKDKELGNFSISFEVQASFGFSLNVDYQIRSWWFVPVGLDYFDVRLTQTDNFSFNFNAEFNIDYKLAGEELAQEYVYNINSLKIHTIECSYVERKTSKPENFVPIKAEELYDYSKKDGFSTCLLCKPVEGLNRTAFVINTSTNKVHCIDCEHARKIALSNRRVCYSLKGFESGDYCSYCNPDSKAERDFEAEMLWSLEYTDWAKKVSEIKEMAKKAGGEEYKPDGIKLFEIHRTLFFPVNFDLEVRFVLSFKFEASLNYAYKQAHTNVYGVRLCYGGINSYSEHTETENSSALNFVGSMDFNAGIKANVGVSILGLSRWIRAGFSAEAGVYVDINGVAHFDDNPKTSDYAAAYLEAGPYYEISAYYKLFKYNGTPTILKGKLPVFVYGYEKAYYGFANEPEDIDLSFGEYDLTQSKIFEVLYYDVINQKSGTQTLALDGGDIYTITLTLNSGEYCSIDGGKIIIKENAPAYFTDVLKISITGKTEWNKYIKGSSAFFIKDVEIPIQYTKDGHSYKLVEKRQPTCKAEGYIIYECTECGEKKQVTLQKLAHEYGDWITDKEATCIETGAKHKTCINCGDEQTEEIRALGHDYNGFCIRCGAADPNYNSTSNEYFTFTLLSDNTYSIKAKDVDNLPSEVIVPLTYNGKLVTRIGNQAFYGCTIIVSIIIPNNIIGIDYWAFRNCSRLTSITISNNVKSIGDCAFYDCSELTDITIPNSVISIGDWAFSGCNKIEKIEVEDGNTKYHVGGNCLIETETKTLIFGLKNSVIPSDGSVTNIGKGAFEGCSELTDIIIPDCITSIGDDAFNSCSGLASIKMPSSVRNIESSAFRYCIGLTSITISSNVKYIGQAAFSGCSGLETIKVASWNTKYRSSGNCLIETETKTLILGCKNSVIPSDGSVVKIGFCSFERCNGLTSIAVPNGVISIDVDAFYYCENLKRITIANTVKDIGDSAFAWCSALIDITLPNNITSISSELFYGCSNLINIIIPNSVTKIDYQAFAWCSNLKNLTISNKLTEISSRAFRNCRKLASITIPNSVTIMGEDVFFGCTELTTISLPSGITSIEAGAFYGCTGLTSITIPDSVTSIGDQAFLRCGLTSITIPNSVTSIGDYVFSGCSGLEKIEVENGNKRYYSSGNCLIETETKTLILGCKNSVIPSDGSVIEIGDTAFYNCSDLTSVIIPDSVTSIGESAFEGCTKLTNITIPNSVTSIGNFAFYNCSALTSVIISNSVISIGDGTFYGCSNLTSIKIPEKVTSIGKNAFEGCAKLTNITIPNSVISIGDSAFYNCSALTSVVVPNSVTSIGESAFGGCGALTSVTLSSNITSIGDGTFSGCGSLKSITIPSGVTKIGYFAFENCNNLAEIKFSGTVEQWNNLTKGYNWNDKVPATKVICSNGEVDL